MIMPTCPNCGSYIPLGNHSCSCGTTIRYVDDEQVRRHDEAVKYSRRRQKCLEQLQKENPYEDDFFNELHHNAVSDILIRNMNYSVQNVKRNYNAELVHVDVMGELAVFTFKVTEKYFEATFKARFGMSSPFNRLTLLEDLVVADFSRLYSNEEFLKLIRLTEKRTCHKFRFCKAMIVDYTVMVAAYFDNGGAWTVDLDNMCLLE